LIRADQTAGIAASATKAAVDLSDDTAKRQLRAYINIHTIQIRFYNWKFNPQIDVIFRNYGQTPAHEVVIYFNILIVRNDGTVIEERNQTHEEPDLGPAQKIYSTFMYPIGDMFMHIDEIKAREARFIVWGRIEYTDTFRKRPWKTEFKYRLPVDSTGVKDKTNLIVDGRDGNVCT
jgi:hypothetical protein